MAFLISVIRAIFSVDQNPYDFYSFSVLEHHHRSEPREEVEAFTMAFVHPSQQHTLDSSTQPTASESDDMPFVSSFGDDLRSKRLLVMSRKVLVIPLPLPHSPCELDWYWY